MKKVRKRKTCTISIYMEARKMVLMNLSAGKQWRHRHREQLYGHRVGGGKGGMNGESSMETYTLPYVKQMPAGICWMTQGTQTRAL